ncbi:MAG TPA: polysaccharide biosynthesis/export family protein [Gemmatimonadaceae bacterium]|nr:polysaccharide biosynthesis/export family protein [Gemmatimonadaceae bacterium]
MKSLSRPLLLVLAVTMLVPAAARAQGSQPPQDLPVQPGDRVLLRIWADTAIVDSAAVGDDGSIMLPRLGPISLAGVPAPAIGDSVRKAYTALLNPVSIEVVPLRRVSVVGEVHNPNVLYLDTRSTVRDAIARAGGIDDIGRDNPITLVRDNARVKLDNWRLRGDAPAIVRSGDVIIVEREPWIKRNVFSIVSGVGIVASLMITIFHK